jgi:hypothetical protein
MSVQVVSTFDLLGEAIQLGRDADVADHCRQILTESEESHSLLPDFVERELCYLRREIDSATLDSEVDRLQELLQRPYGHVPPMDEAWTAFESGLATVRLVAVQGRTTEALELLTTVRHAWQRTHDHYVDVIYGLLDVACHVLGEECVGPMWDEVMVDFYETRDAYAIDRRPWSESFELLLEDTAVSLRGHLSGPRRVGEVEMIEETDRVIFRFNPCGSGGRTMRGDGVDDGIARMNPPYGFAVTTESHDWAWKTEGVCLYCVHCCQLQERVPIQRLGFPLRVVDPPVWRAGADRSSCTWTIYRDPSLVPESSYQRVGLAPPRKKD